MDKKGFSLIELLVVMAIISILSAIATTQYMKYVKNSRYAKMEMVAREAILRAESVYSEYSRYPRGTCNALTSTSDVTCSVNSSLSIVQSSGSFAFKVPSKFSVNFEPIGVKDVRITVTTASGFLKSSSGGSALLIYDSSTSISDFVCVDNEIHGRIWPQGCP